MKKTFALVLAATLMAGAAQAQECFRHLGVSIEAGTTGVGANLSLPLITDHVILTVGYNMPAFTLNKDASIGASGINAKINEANGMINSYNALAREQPMEHIATLNDINASVEAELNMVNYKAFIEYYPTTASRFHFTVGAFIGDGDWVNITATADQAAWRTFDKAREINNMIPQSVEGHPEIHRVQGLDESVKFNIDGQTIMLRPESRGVMKAKLAVEKVKPYLGIGFGSTIPEKRLGFQMELGAYYQKSPKLISADPNTVFVPTFDDSARSEESLDDIMSTVKKFAWYPQITFRFTGRLF